MPRGPKVLFLANWPRTHREMDNYAFFAHWTAPPRVRFFGTFDLGPWTRLEKNKLRFYILQPLLALFLAPFYDAVIAFSSQSGLPFAALLRLCFWCRTKLIVFDVESFGRARSGWKLRLTRFAAKRIDHVVYASRAQENYYETYLPGLNGRNSFVPIGIGPYQKKQPHDAGQDGPIVAVGKHGAAFRDWATLLTAYAMLRESAPLQIIGRADLPEAERGGVPVPPGVAFTPYVPIDKLQDLVELARFVVLPLPERGQSLGQLSLLFSMAMGKAVVASRIIGLTDYLVDGETGLFYEPGNAQDLARCLRRLLDEPELALRLGENAQRAVAEHFNDRRMGGAWEEIFYRVTGLPH